MKATIIVLLLSIGLCFTRTAALFAQTIPFIHNSFNTDSTESLTQFCESATERYLFAGDRKHADSSGFVVLTDKSGNVLRSRYLIANADVYFTSAVANSDFTFGVYGILKRRSDSSHRFFYCRIDSSFNVLFSKSDMLLEKNVVKKAGFSASMYSSFSGGSLYSDMRCEVYRIDSPSLTTFVYKSIKHTEYMDTVFTKAGLALGNIASGVANGTFVGVSLNRMLRFDTNFVVLDSMEILDRNVGVPFSTSDSFMGAGGVRITPVEILPKRLFLGVRFRALPPIDNFAWGGTLFDLNSKRIIRKDCFPFHTIYVQPQSAVQPIIKHNDKIYYTGYYSVGGALSDRIVVAKHDTSGKAEWVKTYSSSSVPMESRAIFGTSDGGILILATKDTTNSWGTIQQDLFVIKIDADGNPLSIKSLSAQLRPKVSVYPNPATDELYFAGLPNNATGICVFNSSGQLMSMHNLQTADIRISLQQLLPATYYYSVVDADGRVLSGGSFVKL